MFPLEEGAGVHLEKRSVVPDQDEEEEEEGKEYNFVLNQSLILWAENMVELVTWVSCSGLIFVETCSSPLLSMRTLSKPVKRNIVRILI